MPTKEETVNSIHKKLQETIGFEVYEGGTSTKFAQLWFRRSGANVEVGVVGTGGRVTSGAAAASEQHRPNRVAAPARFLVRTMP